MTDQLLLTCSKWNALLCASVGLSSVFRRRRDVFRVGVEKNELYWFQGGKKKGGKASRGTPTSLSWIMSSTCSDKWTVEWERTPWNQIEYGLLWPGFIALGYPKPGSHKLMQLKWGVSGGLLLWFVYCGRHPRTIQMAGHCCPTTGLVNRIYTDRS